MELICKCGEPMSEHDPGVSSYFTLSFSCTSCDSTAEVSFTADDDVEFTDGDGETSIVSLQEIER